MRKTIGVMAVVATFAIGGIAIGGTPFGGDDAGTIPSDAPKGPVTKCENTVGKGVAKLVGAIVKCHASRVSGKLADDSAENACEGAAETKFEATKTAGCTACTNLASTAAAVEGLVDGNNNKVYCSAGTPFGGDDAGNIPTDAPKGPVTKCDGVVAKAVAKLVTAVNKCHAGRATGKFPDDTSEDGCESAALTKFNATKTTGCDPCTNLSSIGAFVVSTDDGANGLVYCGSPSGAFLSNPSF